MLSFVGGQVKREMYWGLYAFLADSPFRAAMKSRKESFSGTTMHTCDVCDCISANKARAPGGIPPEITFYQNSTRISTRNQKGPRWHQKWISSAQGGGPGRLSPGCLPASCGPAWAMSWLLCVLSMFVHPPPCRLADSGSTGCGPKGWHACGVHR